MDDTKVTASAAPITISGKEFRASPLSDRDLGFLTNYVRYHINKRAREEAEFAASPAEAAEIQKKAFEVANGIIWYEANALRILSTPDGTAKVAYQMLRKEHPDIDEEWLQKQFGSNTTMLGVHIENTIRIRNAFGSLNSLTTDVVEETDDSSKKKAKKKKNQ